jgi:tetratricopeptide (TPR) repeat protein
MGRSLSPINATSLESALKHAKPVYDPKTDFFYEVFEREGRIGLREYRIEAGEVVFEQTRYARYQVGSGNQTVSFIEEVNGYLFEMPLTWYTNKRIWDLSPGYEFHNWRFDRPISSSCMNCHNSPTVRTAETENHFTNVPFGIGCENCHGPGGEHVALALEGRITKWQRDNLAIVSPDRLDRTIQMDICQTCHLEGIAVWNDSIEPHMVEVARPLVTYKQVFAASTALESESEFAIAAQAGRLRKSLCYQKSDVMTCTTCHDPHRPPELQGREAFNVTCNSCHSDAMAHTLCSLPNASVANNSDCISCHMNVGETSDIPHVSFTDHYIRRSIRREERTPKTEKKQPTQLIPVLTSDDTVEQKRALGLAYFDYFQNHQSDLRFLDSTIHYLERVLRQKPARRDGEDLYALGNAYFLKGNFTEAERKFKGAIVQNPQHARAHQMLGRTLLATGAIDGAVSAFSEGIHAQPLLIENHLGLAEALLQRGDLNEAFRHAQEAIRLDSLSYPDAFVLLGRIEEARGNTMEARGYYIQTLQRNPDHRTALINIGALLMQEKRWEEAIIFFDQVLKKDPRHVGALNNVLVCLINLQRRREAREVAQQILALQPDHSQARKALTFLGR